MRDDLDGVDVKPQVWCVVTVGTSNLRCGDSQRTLGSLRATRSLFQAEQ
jgi:hypothetical protein